MLAGDAMTPDIVIILGEDMPPEEQEDLASLIRGLVHNEWYGQYSNTVIGPMDSDAGVVRKFQ